MAPVLTRDYGSQCRACPGRNLAEATLWIEIASMLSVFTFSLAKHKDGRDIDINYATDPKGEFVSLVSVHFILWHSSPNAIE
jgi:hypothetical protein